MSTPTMLAASQMRPRLRPDVLLGPPGRAGARTVHYLKDPQADRFYRVGAREFFVIARLDGSRTLEQISVEYAREYGARLGQQAWAQMFGLLGQRNLLAQGYDPARAEQLRAEGVAQRWAANRGLWRRRFALARPDALLSRWVGRLGFAFRPWFVISVLLAAAILEAYVFTRWGTLFHDGTLPGVWLKVLPASLVTFWAIVALHEFSHGLACRRFGGSVTEMGVIWNYLRLNPYCKVDDIVLLPNRWHRVAVAFAGGFTTFGALVPFGLLHASAPPGSAVRTYAAMLLIIGSVTGIMNLMPFVSLDGYHMLGHALGRVDLRAHSYAFARAAFRAVLRRERTGLVGYTRADRWIYGGYAVLSVPATTVLVGAMVLLWFTRFSYLWGPVAAWSLIIGIAVVSTAVEVRRRRRAKSPTRKARHVPKHAVRRRGAPR